MTTQNNEVFTARVSRTKYAPCFIAHLEGGAADGLELLLRPCPRERRRWVYAARKNAVINVTVEAERVRARLDSWNADSGAGELK